MSFLDQLTTIFVRRIYVTNTIPPHLRYLLDKSGIAPGLIPVRSTRICAYNLMKNALDLMKISREKVKRRGIATIVIIHLNWSVCRLALGEKVALRDKQIFLNWFHEIIVEATEPPAWSPERNRE